MSLLAFGAASNHAGRVDAVYWYVTAISAVLMLGVTVAMGWFCWRYHRSRSPRAEHVHDSMALELTWTILPTILVMTMFWFGWVVFRDMREKPPGAMTINVTASQWTWKYTYLNEKGEVYFEVIAAEAEKQGEDAELVLPLHKPVVLNLASTDVLHAFFVPAFRVKEDAVPGRETYVSFTATAPGVYPLLCAEYCGGGNVEKTAYKFEVSDVPVTLGELGDQMVQAVLKDKKIVLLHITGTRVVEEHVLPEGQSPYRIGTLVIKVKKTGPNSIETERDLEKGHWSMLSKVRVVPAEQFDAYYKSGGKIRPWKTGEKKTASVGAGLPRGMETMSKLGCLTCHSTDGTFNPNGPTLQGVFGRERRVVKDGDVATVKADEAYLRRSILDPGVEELEEYKGKVGPMNPPRDITEEQLNEIVQYLKELK